MQRHAIAVIGAGFGDEGKGASVDRLTEGPETLVVRFNGGAQAGHTVVAADGRRHIFHHVGSGALKGARTFLSRFFVANPLVLGQELDELALIGVRPRILADARALLTTPYDMLVNQVVEIARGAGRHGSCGVGFGETIERAEKGFATTLGDIGSSDLRVRLENIRDVWVPQRLKTLGVGEIPFDYRAFFEGDAMLESFLEALDAIAGVVEIGGDEPLRRASDVVFEGAQGLELDQDRGAFPFVTRSNTGLKNVLSLCAETGIEALEAVYATRCYRTRHGAGPLAAELAQKPFAGIVDETNAPNAWQGTLRFAHLDVDALASAIGADLGDAGGSGVFVTPSLALNCLDQAPDRLPVVMGGKLADVGPSALLDLLNARIGLSGGMEGFGPGSQDYALRRAVGVSNRRPALLCA